jgi:hypothetical protein
MRHFSRLIDAAFASSLSVGLMWAFGLGPSWTMFLFITLALFIIMGWSDVKG